MIEQGQLIGGSGELILVIEDDTALCRGLAKMLRLYGYEVVTAADGEQGMAHAFNDRPNLILLDLMLPGWNGLEILSALRERGESTPVIILSAKGELDDKIQGLYLGADDYVTKPFDLPELLMRIAVKLRRVRDELEAAVIVLGELEVRPGDKDARLAGKPLALGLKEFGILYLLARHPGRVFSRTDILNSVWGWGYEGSPRTVDNYIHSLRQGIEQDPENPKLILTIRGIGYKLVESLGSVAR